MNWVPSDGAGRRQESKPLNIILVLVDSLRRDQLGYGGGPPERTPALNAFGERAWSFENHFVGSLPCMPARREIYAGRREFLWRPWGPLEPFDDSLPRRLSQAGYRTAITTDHYHYWEEQGNGYLQSFQSTELIRGHELDNWKTPFDEHEPLPRWVENIERWRPGQGRRYYANVCGFDDERDYFPPQVMRAAGAWLERHAAEDGPFFLQVESFDVHEPFDVPEPYASLYGDATGRDRYTVWPPYQDVRAQAAFMAAASPAELEFIRSQYRGKVTMVDRWLGKLFAVIGRLGLWETTAVVVTTDHGHDLGEHGQFGKGYPHFDSHANIPLLIWHPGYAEGAKRVQALTTTADLHATVLDMGGLRCGAGLPSRSLLPLLQGSVEAMHEGLVYGSFGQGICCTDGDWTLFNPLHGEGPLYYYSTSLYHPPADGRERTIEAGHFMPGIAMPQWKVPVNTERRPSMNALYNRREDPAQTWNRWQEAPGARQRMRELLVTLVEEQGGCPPEQVSRLGLERPLWTVTLPAGRDDIGGKA